MPDPDLFIRTGGEHRISNFLLWNLAYTELYFTDKLWPEFDVPAFEVALQFYAARHGADFWIDRRAAAGDSETGASHLSCCAYAPVIALALAVLLIAAIVYLTGPDHAGDFAGIVQLIGAPLVVRVPRHGAAGRASCMWRCLRSFGFFALVFRLLDPLHFVLAMEFTLCWWVFALLWIMWAPQRRGRSPP